MKKIKIVDQDFYRQAGPRKMYGWVRILGEYNSSFSFKSIYRWPCNYDEKRYLDAIYGGVLTAFREIGKEPFGNFQVLEVNFSQDDEANVPFAYREAAKRATNKIIQEWIDSLER